MHSSLWDLSRGIAGTMIIRLYIHTGWKKGLALDGGIESANFEEGLDEREGLCAADCKAHSTYLIRFDVYSRYDGK